MTLFQGGEDAENATASASSPGEEKSAASSPSADEQVAAPVAAAEPKEEAAAVSPAAASPAEEKKEEPTPSAPTPVPSVEDKKEEAVEKVEAEKKVVEVSQSAGGQSVTDPVEVPVYRVQPVATPSIIERKTSEDLPSLPPSSPPPTPIDPSPLQQARQAAASATALAEALKLPTVSTVEEQSTSQSDVSRVNVSQQSRAESTTFAVASPPSLGPYTDLPPTEATFVLAEVECAPEIEVETSRDETRETVASSLDNERVMKPIELRAECVSESLVAIGEVSKCQENEANRTEKPLDELLDNKSEGAAKGKVECPLVSKEVNPNSSVKESDKLSEVVTMVEKVSDSGAIDKVMNEALPVAECQVKSEINSREDAMKINVPSDAGHNKKAEVGTLPSTEIETNGACPAVEQHLSSGNFETEKMNSFPNETMQLPSYEKCVEKEKSSGIDSTFSTELIDSSYKESNAEVSEQTCKRIEYEHGYAKDPTEIEEEKFINSEEGPLSVSDDILVEAKPAVVIPEDDSVEELTDTTESVKVIPETDEEKIENELESDIALPTEETLISEEVEDNISAPKDAAIEQPLNELAGVPDSFTKNETKTFDIEDSLPSPPEDLTAFSLQTPELQSTVSAIKAEPIVASSLQIEQTEEGERCSLSPKHRIASPGESSCPLNDSEPTHRSPSRLSDAPTNSLSERHSNESQTRVLSPESESVPISLEDLPPAPEDTGAQSLDSFDYPLPPEELSCPSPLVIPPNASVLELPSAPVEHAANPRDPTETLLTPPVSPNHQSNISLASGIATETATKDRSQIPLYDQDDGEQSLSKPQTNSCNQSNIELKGRLTTEYSTKTESQEGALSCQLSNIVPSIATKEHHQVTNTTSWHECDQPKFFGGRFVPRISPYGPHSTVSVVL